MKFILIIVLMFLVDMEAQEYERVKSCQDLDGEYIEVIHLFDDTPFLMPADSHECKKLKEVL